MFLARTNSSAITTGLVTPEKLSERYTTLDLLRGFFLFLALCQHYSTFTRAQTGMPFGTIQYFLYEFFTPVVSQIYVALAAFNLARGGRVMARARYKRKCQEYFMVFCLFALEEFITRPTLNDKFVYSSIMNWMVILFICLTIYAFVGIRAIGAGFFLALLFWAIPMNDVDTWFEKAVAQLFQFPFHYEEKIYYFINSGFLGLLLGHLFYEKKEWIGKLAPYAFAIFLVISVAYFFWGKKQVLDARDAFLNEYDVIRTFLGAWFIWTVEVMTFYVFFFLEKKKIRPSFSLFDWMGRNSLQIFFWHKILFFTVALPLSLHYVNLFYKPLLFNDMHLICFQIMISLALMRFLMAGKNSVIPKSQ